MFLPDKLFEKGLYWGPLFVGVISLVLGMIVLRPALHSSTDGSSMIAERKVLKAYRKKAAPDKAKILPPKTLTLAQKQRDKVKHSTDIIKQVTPSAEEALEVATKLDPKSALKPERVPVPKDKPARLSIDKSQLAEKSERTHDDILRTVLAQRGRQAGQFGATFRQKAFEIGDGALSVKQEHLAMFAGERLALLGGVGFEGVEVAIADSKGRLLLTGAKKWGRLTGKLGSKMEVALKAGILTGSQAPLAAFIYDLSKPLGTEAQVLSRVIALGGTAGESYKLVQFSRQFGRGTSKDIGPHYSQFLKLAALSGTRFQLAYMGALMGAQPDFSFQGLAQSVSSADNLRLHYNLSQYGEVMGQVSAKFVTAGLKGFDESVVRYVKRTNMELNEQQEHKLALLTLPQNGEEELVKKSCSENFHAILQHVRATKIATLRQDLKPLFALDKSLPGKWIFRLTTAPKRRRCLRYKRYNSGRKKCKKWSKSVRTVAANYLSPLEKQFVIRAQKLVFSKGRDPALKPRSANHWVINQISNDLNSYSRQPLNPAICTGAIRMVDYFEGNLSRVKKLVTFVNEVAEQANGLLDSRRLHLEAILTNAANETALKQQQSVSVIPKDTIDNASDRSLDRNIEEPATVRTVSLPRVSLPKIKSDDLLGSLIKLSDQLFGGAQVEGLDDHPQFLVALRSVARHYKSNGVIMPMDASGRQALRGLLGMMEASFYISNAQQRMQVIDTRLFGSLNSIREGYGTACSCEVSNLQTYYLKRP